MDLSCISKQCQLAGFTPELQEDIGFHFNHCRICQQLYKHDNELKDRFQSEELEATLAEGTTQ